MLPDNILTSINVPTSDLIFKKPIQSSNAKVDIYIAKAIQLLNDKGYKTICCCSGHTHRDADGLTDVLMRGYVWFENKLSTAPYGWYIDDFKMPTGGDCIRYEAKKSHKGLMKKMKKLMRWAKALPDIN